ncbi:uncharacterized protein LOC113569395 [Electrophorus electricus]|uniref:uncharacterized protein LOC113569395 n=1 Tax=Electrophorus electricus TaxID=8005 RepID=UPI0015D075E5|nr:uncharacterized protein LOC113569395 [Electrophorus electricus]
MLSCSRCHCVLLLQLRTVIAGSFPSVKVNLHDDATLPCTQTCSGLVTWTLYHKPHDVLAQCNQTSCQSEEGFHMSHDQYLKGDLSLTITDADYTKRSLYTCACKGQELCDVSLQIEACNSSVQIKPGEPLVLDLLISESVEVIYNSTGAAAPSSGQICTVAGHSLKCKPEYTQRVLLISAVELQGTTPSDSGVYIIRDTKHEEIIQTYTVTVEELDPAKTAKAMVEAKYQQAKANPKVEVQKVHAATVVLSEEKKVSGSKVVLLLKMVEKMLQEEAAKATVPVASELGETSSGSLGKSSTQHEHYIAGNAARPKIQITWIL